MKITICGSMTFHKEMENIGKELEAKGNEVKVPVLKMQSESEGLTRNYSIATHIEEGGGVDNFDASHPIWDKKSEAIDEHFDKIEWADAILVANYDKKGILGYIGGNSLMEMAIAKYLKKKIFILKPVSSQMNYKEEILGMKPVILNDDLSKVN